MPHNTPVHDLFGESDNTSASALDMYLAKPMITPSKNGKQEKQIIWQDMQAHLGSGTSLIWAMQSVTRTGSATSRTGL